MKSPLRMRWCAACLVLLLPALVPLSASAASPKRVLILDPFGRDVAPFSEAVSSFRATLAREMGERVDIYELPLELARLAEAEGEAPLVAFLEGQVKAHPVDLVVAIGGPGVQFAARHRQRLFPRTPVLAVAVASQLVPPDFLQTNTTLVTQKANLPGIVEDILRLQPQTTNIAVVFGTSALERFWVEECRREFQPFTNRVKFTWLNDLSSDQILERCATLPPHSFIFYGFFIVDAAGTHFENNEILRRLHEIANAPVFSYFASELGLGSIGGRLFQDTELGALGARTAIRILRGEQADRIPAQTMEAPRPTYDWRELRRWGIDESRLPSGSVIRYRQPTFWESYRWHIVGVVLFCLLQTALIVGLVTNARAKTRAARVLRESEERMTLAAEAAQFGVWVWTIAHNRVWGSERWRGLFQFGPSEDVSFEEVVQRIHPDDRETVERELRRALASRSDYAGEFRALLPDGSQRWIASRGRVSADVSGTPTRMMGTAVDISEVKRAATELQGLRLQLWHADRVAQTGAITASLAHELNQPLTGILSTAQAGLRFTASGNADWALIHEMLSNVVHDTKRAAGVVNGLRAMLVRRETRREPIDLAATTQDVLNLVHSELIGRQVQASQSLEPQLTVVADRGQIQQVLLNLIMNALEAMQDQPAQQRHLKLALARTETGEALFALRDSGPGVPEEGQEKLFEAFWTTKKEGMGIGLVVSRSIIESHGGRLWFANNPDGGATFYFTLPAPGRSDGQTFRKEAATDAE